MKKAGIKERASRIEIINLNKACRINRKFFKRIAEDVLAFIKKPKTTLEIIFLDNKSIKIFNKRYKKRDAPTDVLSFKIGRREFGNNSFLGEVLISSERAFENAKIFKTDFEEELVLYAIHGILHLFGYDDESPGDRSVMARKEKETLRYLCKREDLSKVLMPR